MVNTPERTTAAAYPRYLMTEVLADSGSLQWRGLYVRRYRCPRVVDRFLVPATPEPLVSCTLTGIAEFKERDPGGSWMTRHLGKGDLFVTRSKTPYEVKFSSPRGQELEVVQVHVAVERFMPALKEVYGENAGRAEVTDYFGRDEPLSYLCFACAELLAERVQGKSRRIADLSRLFASYLVEKYTIPTESKPEYQGGLPIWQLRKVEDYVREHLAEEVPVQQLADTVELSAFHFSRRFKHATGLTPHQYITRERITRAQQVMRETSRSLIEIGMEVGFTNPSHFAKVFRQVTGVTPTGFRSAL